MSSSLFHLLFHLIFTTKKRTTVISPNMETTLYPYLGGIVRNYKSTLLQIGGTVDHLHLLIKLHPEVAISEIMRILKANSSKWIRSQFEEARDFAWQTGYGAFSVSESQVSKVRDYIQNQKKHHLKVGFKEELAGILEKHRMSLDSLRFWD